MNKKSNLVLIFANLIFLFVGSVSYGQKNNTIESRWENYISLKEYLVPFWKADTIYDELVQVINENEISVGTLLFPAKEILSVRSADLTKEFIWKKDWLYKDGRILLVSNSTIPFLKKEDLVFNVEKPGWSMLGKAKGSFVLFSESTFFRSKQIAVTYIPENFASWKGPLPFYAKKGLAHSLLTLRKRMPFKVVFYGNSIETGANSSGFQNDRPYMPSWPELIVYNLREEYGHQVSFSNQSVGGMMAQWGQDEVMRLVVPEKPDLVIIGFGMNDGSAGVAPKKYRNNIKSIIDSVLHYNPKSEFILIAPMLANPDAIQSNIQQLYKKELDKLAGKGIVVADLTNVHAELLKYKRYQDMSGNNINHPNDYLSRWYAQFISGFLIEEK